MISSHCCCLKWLLFISSLSDQTNVVTVQKSNAQATLSNVQTQALLQQVRRRTHENEDVLCSEILENVVLLDAHWWAAYLDNILRADDLIWWWSFSYRLFINLIYINGLCVCACSWAWILRSCCFSRRRRSSSPQPCSSLWVNRAAPLEQISPPPQPRP